MKRWLLLLAACGGGSVPSTGATGPAAAMVATAAPGDVQVATVNGRPVWGACVVDQSKRDPKLTRQQALQQCVDFELLAQAAERNHLDTYPEVVDATRTALVSRLVDRFVAQYPNPDAVSAQIDDVYKTQGARLDRPELRGSWHVLIKAARKQMPKFPPPATEAELRTARELAETVYERLKDETGLFPDQLKAAAADLKAPKDTIEVSSVPTMAIDGAFAPEYKGALFAIPDVGRISPVTQTDFGFHVILMTELLPAEKMPREMVFEGLRRQTFMQYVAELMKGVHVEKFPLPEEEGGS